VPAFRSDARAGRRHLVRFALTAVLVVTLCGCTINDPTEDTVGLRVTNDLGVPARFGVCGSYDCHSRSYTDGDDAMMRPGETSDWNAGSDPSVVNPFRVEVAGMPDRCLFVRYRRAKTGASVRLSQAGSCDQSAHVTLVP
jgi:hypothetical protein